MYAIILESLFLNNENKLNFEKKYFKLIVNNVDRRYHYLLPYLSNILICIVNVHMLTQHTEPHTNTQKRTQTCSRTHKHAEEHTNMQKHTQTCRSTHKHTDMNTCMHIHKCVHKNIHPLAHSFFIEI